MTYRARLLALVLSLPLLGFAPGRLWAQANRSAGPIIRISAAQQRVEMIVNSSRILTLEKKIPQAQVNNPEVVDIKPLSANQIQLIAKKTGVTQVNLWDQQGRIYTVDVVVRGDARELEMAIKHFFPHATIKVYPLANSVVLYGHTNNPNDVARIAELASDYFPKVINNITVGGVQQVLLHVKVMEVSRTKLRTLGFDWAKITGDDFIISGASDLLTATTSATVTSNSGVNMAFGIVSGNDAFFGVLEALRRNNVVKVLAEPTLVTVSGRPAYFQVGGEFPVLIPQSLGTVSVQYKPYGTQVDFVPIVLANGNIRLEVRPRVSEIDDSRSVILGSISVPALRTRTVDTGVEMRAGQVLAIAGLVQTRMEAETKGFPWVADVPYLGALFRRQNNRENEVELLILVRPELVSAVEPHELPPGGPGTFTASPNDCEMYLKGYLEVPRCGLPMPGTAAPVQLPQQSGPSAEPIQPPQSQGKGAAVLRRIPAVPTSARHAARPRTTRPPATPGRPPGPSQLRNRYTRPPGFIGPVGYDDAR